MNEQATEQVNEQVNEDRAEEFKEQIAAMRTKTSNASSEQVLLVIGILLMLVGIGLGIGSYFSATNSSQALDQNELIILAISGVSISLMGVAVFLRYSIGRFLRFWLLRQIYENRNEGSGGSGAGGDSGGKG